MRTYVPDAMLNKPRALPRGDTGDGIPAHENQPESSFSYDTYLWIAFAILTGVFVGVCGYLSFQPRKRQVQDSHILLDEGPHRSI